MKPYVFLDRDGTIIAERNYLAAPDEVELLPQTGAGLRRMLELGYGLVVVTNQSGVGRGYFSSADVERVHRRMNELLLAEGVELAGVHYCPHLPTTGCTCRKPEPGMIEAACATLSVDRMRSAMIGDKPCDILLGRRCDLRTILVQTGYGSCGDARPDAIVADLSEAAAVLAEWQGAHPSAT